MKTKLFQVASELAYFVSQAVRKNISVAISSADFILFATYVRYFFFFLKVRSSNLNMDWDENEE